MNTTQRLWNDKVNLGIGFLRDHNDNIQFLVYLVSI